MVCSRGVELRSIEEPRRKDIIKAETRRHKQKTRYYHARRETRGDQKECPRNGTEQKEKKRKKEE